MAPKTRVPLLNVASRRSRHLDLSVTGMLERRKSSPNLCQDLEIDVADEHRFLVLALTQDLSPRIDDHCSPEAGPPLVVLTRRTVIGTPELVWAPPPWSEDYLTAGFKSSRGSGYGSRLSSVLCWGAK